MKKALLPLAISLCLASVAGCQQTAPTEQTAVVADKQVDAAFDQYALMFIDDLWQLSPTWALYNGKHVNDGYLEVPDQGSRQKTLVFIDKHLQGLSQFKTSSLSANQMIDHALIENLLKKMQWEIKVFKSWQWQPSKYNVAGGFAQIINEDFAPLDQRLASVIERLQNVPAYYQAARTNIENPTLEHTQLAIMQNKGAFSVLSEDLKQQVSQSGLSDELKKTFNSRFDLAIKAIEQHIVWLTNLEESLQENGAKSFRIGEEFYEQKFAFDIQAGMSGKALYDKAIADKNQIQLEMAKITRDIWSKYIDTPIPNDDKVAIKQLIDVLSAKHVKRENFVEEVRAQIPELVKFVNDKDLITLDPNKPLIVRETPEYMRGFAGASISAPGPYDKGGNTYYNVSPLDGMSDESAESYLREYNHWILQILNIHEAIPGHYTQLVYSNESPSLVKSLFGNGAMVEGWAVYTERMMLEQGYGNFEPEMWLMYYKWNLRVICNTILDYSIQVKGMQEQQALDLMMNEAFQQQAEAQGKWRRATLSQVQLTSYYSGYREIYDLREELKQAQGDDFDLKLFHENFLSYGSAPVKYIKQLMQ
ncbi:DUF885 domain-containing protein [Shewanella maritima]|uniref:DUF885 domain-containing protein n=1 Tax=Shewanella maritima TaxID=2520507 RepID=UPI0037366BDC